MDGLTPEGCWISDGPNAQMEPDEGCPGKCGQVSTSRGVDKEGSAGTGEGRDNEAKGQGGELVPRGGSIKAWGIREEGRGSALRVAGGLGAHT